MTLPFLFINKGADLKYTDNYWIILNKTVKFNSI